MKKLILLSVMVLVLMGCGAPPPSGQNPMPQGQTAFDDNVYFAASPDGINWSEGRLLAKLASVPDVLYSSKGEFWAYWVDFTNMKQPGDEKISVAKSIDGANWETLGSAAFTGAEGLVPVDPNVDELSDGRFRMYFFDITRHQGNNKIYSAVSSDGMNFALEEGVRFEYENVYDPNVITLPDGRLRMYLNHTDIISAMSEDGVTFTLDDGVRIEKGGVPGAVVLDDGRILLYACTRGISAYESMDGLNFTLLKEGAVTSGGDSAFVCDPSVALHPGGYLMVYKGKLK